MRLPLAFVGGKPGNPALITAYDTVFLSVSYYYYSGILRVIFFLFSPFSFDTSPHLYTTTAISLSSSSRLARIGESKAAVRLFSPVSRYSRPVYVRTLYFVQRYLPGLI